MHVFQYFYFLKMYPCFCIFLYLLFLRIKFSAFWQLGLKRKCIFPFLRKCKNHAKMGRFSRNFMKFSFAKIFCFLENLKKISQKLSRNFFSKILSIFLKNSDFCEKFSENECNFLKKFYGSKHFSLKNLKFSWNQKNFSFREYRVSIL
jgi:hypothetical protein